MIGCFNHRVQWRYYGGGGGGRTPAQTARRAPLTYNLHGTASKPYVDQEMDIRTFCVTQDREKPTDST